jgi:aryl carrier-like protein
MIPPARLARWAAAEPPSTVEDAAPASGPQRAAPPGDDVHTAVAHAWREVLGTGGHGPDERFFDVGGDSLRLLRVAAILRRSLPGCDVTVQDLYTGQTIAATARLLSDRVGGRL